MKPPLPSPDGFSLLPGIAKEYMETIRRVSGWRWIASSGYDIAAPIRHPAHEKWIREKGSLHTPAHREIMFPLFGEKVFSLNREAYHFTPGSVFLFDHAEARDWVEAPHNLIRPTTALWIHFFRKPHCYVVYNTFSCDGKGKTYREITRRVCSGELPAKIMAAWDQHKAHPEEPLYWELLRAFSTSLLLEILEVTQAKSPPGHQRQVIEVTHQYIANHLGEDLSLELLARIAGYSPFFFHRIFREYTGQTPKEYIDRQRYEKAAELLRQPMTITAIAQQLGFSSPYSFSRFFKEKSGFSPKNWRALDARPPAAPGKS